MLYTHTFVHRGMTMWSPCRYIYTRVCLCVCVCACVCVVAGAISKTSTPPVLRKREMDTELIHTRHCCINVYIHIDHSQPCTWRRLKPNAWRQRQAAAQPQRASSILLSLLPSQGPSLIAQRDIMYVCMCVLACMCACCHINASTRGRSQANS